MLLLALSLALSQLLLSAHEVHHLDADSDEEHCELCLIGGGLGQAGLADASVFGIVPLDKRGFFPTSDYTTRTFSAGYHPRAPPSPTNAVVMN